MYVCMCVYIYIYIYTLYIYIPRLTFDPDKFFLSCEFSLGYRRSDLMNLKVQASTFQSEGPRSQNLGSPRSQDALESS